MRKLPLLMLLLAAVPALVHAQPAQPANDLDEAARQIFESGRTAFAAGDYDTALARFRSAFDLSHRPGLLYNIAQALDRLRRDAETLQTLRQYIQAQPDAPNRGEVEARIRVLDDAIRAHRQATPIGPVSRPPLHPAIFIATAGVAVAASALGLIFGLMTLDANDAYNRSNDLATATGHYNDANTFQALTNVFFIAGGAAAVGAVVLLFLTDWDAFSGAPAATPAHARPSLLPTFSMSQNGAVGGAILRF